jgi:hypothetical protein
MEWSLGVAGGIMLGGLFFGGIIGSLPIVLLTLAAGAGIAGLASWYTHEQAEQADGRKLGGYPPYGY